MAFAELLSSGVERFLGRREDADEEVRGSAPLKQENVSVEAKEIKVTPWTLLEDDSERAKPIRDAVRTALDSTYIPIAAKLTLLPDYPDTRFRVNTKVEDEEAAIWLPPQWQPVLQAFQNYAERAGADEGTLFWITSHHVEENAEVPQSILIYTLEETDERMQRSFMRFILSEDTRLWVETNPAYYDLGSLDEGIAYAEQERKFKEMMPAAMIGLTQEVMNHEALEL